MPPAMRPYAPMTCSRRRRQQLQNRSVTLITTDLLFAGLCRLLRVNRNAQ
jgi:hypothetical protein